MDFKEKVQQMSIRLKQEAIWCRSKTFRQWKLKYLSNITMYYLYKNISTQDYYVFCDIMDRIADELIEMIPRHKTMVLKNNINIIIKKIKNINESKYCFCKYPSITHLWFQEFETSLNRL